MTVRRKDQPDTAADIALREMLTAEHRSSFVVIAGAGSGKTTSLVKALDTVVSNHSRQLKARRQRVACITYTEIAAGEIWADVGSNPLVHVSTIHSFLWMISRSFQSDIKKWVELRLREKIAELDAEAQAFGPRVQQRTRDKNRRDVTRYQQNIERLTSISAFMYGTGSNYPKGVLGHDDVLRLGTYLIENRSAFRSLISQQFPFIFVDESQDTTSGVVDALKAIDAQVTGGFCLGFFGDPMQRIYATGVGDIVAGDDWLDLKKPENFRCPRRVLNVANAIRREGDGLEQTRGRTLRDGDQDIPVEGSARVFVLPADDARDENVQRVRAWIARANNDPAWEDNNAAAVKLLVIVHRMAAKRLGFGALYASLNDKAPESFKNGFLDASAWPLRPFMTFALPLSAAISRGDEFAAVSVLRSRSAILAKEFIAGKDVAGLLASARAASKRLEEMMRPGSGETIRSVLAHLRQTGLLALDPRMTSYLDEQPPRIEQEDGVDEEAVAETAKEIAAMDAFLHCEPSEFWGYRTYLEDQSPFSTHQGIKGAEFDRVLVVLDDEEGTHFQFSYNKYFGITPLSERDQANAAEGKGTIVDRTMRLFYVCCTRARKDLVVVLFSADPEVAIKCVREKGIFPDEDVRTLADLK